MTRRPAAIALVLTAAAVIAGTFVLPPAQAVEAILTRLLGLAFAVVGYLAVGAPKGRRMGWLCIAIGVVTVGFDIGLGYAETRGPGAAWAFWTGTVLSQASPVLILMVLPAWFPTGRVLGPRWRWLDPVAAVVLLLAMTAAATDGDLQVLVGDGVLGRNPFPLQVSESVEEVLFLAVAGLGTVCIVGALTSLVLRFRRSRGVERQQLRWLVAGVLAAVLSMGVILVGFVLGLEDGPLVDGAFGVAMLTQPAAIGVALTRHRLYDLDRVVSRTVAYAAVAAVLAGGYLASVVVLGAFARAVSGESGDLVVALSTLAVAAIFQPVRRRVRAAVDRRFDRARYDAAQTIDDFGRGLRDEVSLQAITTQLCVVAGSTFRPDSVGVVLTPIDKGSPG